MQLQPGLLRTSESDTIAEALAQLSNERPGLRIRITQVGPDEVSAAVLSRDHELGIGSRESQFPHEQLVIEPTKQRRVCLPCWPGHPLLAIGPTVEKGLAFPLVTALLQGRAGELCLTARARHSRCRS